MDDATIARLYYEAHITIDPVFDQARVEAGVIADRHGFQLAELIMRKSRRERERQHQDDTFMTARAKRWFDIRTRTRAAVNELLRCGYGVRRWKIEDTLLDSKAGDLLP